MVFRVYLHAFDFLGECKIYSLYFVYSVETENTGQGNGSKSVFGACYVFSCI